MAGICGGGVCVTGICGGGVCGAGDDPRPGDCHDGGKQDELERRIPRFRQCTGSCVDLGCGVT